jgi:hypothetical protein
MRHGGSFHFLGALALVCAVGVLMALAYGAGAASSGAAAAVGSGGWNFLGFLFALFIVVLIFGMVGRASGWHGHRAWAQAGPCSPGARAWRGHGSWHGYGIWQDEECRQAAKSALDEWHRQAHAEASPTSAEQPPDQTVEAQGGQAAR